MAQSLSTIDLNNSHPDEIRRLFAHTTEEDRTEDVLRYRPFADWGEFAQKLGYPEGVVTAFQALGAVIQPRVPNE